MIVDDGENREDLTRQVGLEARHGDQIDVGGVEHELERHQHEDDVVTYLLDLGAVACGEFVGEFERHLAGARFRGVELAIDGFEV